MLDYKWRLRVQWPYWCDGCWCIRQPVVPFQEKLCCILRQRSGQYFINAPRSVAYCFFRQKLIRNAANLYMQLRRTQILISFSGLHIRITGQHFSICFVKQPSTGNRNSKYLLWPVHPKIRAALDPIPLRRFSTD